MHCVIIDDDMISNENLSHKIREYFKDVKIDIYTNHEDIEQLSQDYDVIFLDLYFNGENKGIQLAEKIQRKYPFTPLVFISSLSSAIFSSQIVDHFCFIRKAELDIDFDTFIRLYFRTHRKIEIENHSKKQFINIFEIIYIESLDHKLIVHTEKGEFHIWKSLKTVEEDLESFPEFIRIQRSYIVNLRYVVDTDNRIIKMKNRKRLTIGRGYKTDFYKKFEKLEKNN